MSDNPWGDPEESTPLPYVPPPPLPSTFPLTDDDWDNRNTSGWGDALPSTPPPLRAASPALPSPSRSSPTFDAIPPHRAATPPNHDDDDWGDHGNEPNLPTLANFPTTPSHDPHPDQDWPQENEERDWKPPEIDSALPTFGQSFATNKEPKSEEDRGWHDERDLNWEGSAANLTLQDTADDGGQGWEDHSAKQGRSIVSCTFWTRYSTPHHHSLQPAAFVEDLKAESSRLADTNWKVTSDSWNLESATRNESDGVYVPSSP